MFRLRVTASAIIEVDETEFDSKEQALEYFTQNECEDAFQNLVDQISDNAVNQPGDEFERKVTVEVLE